MYRLTLPPGPFGCIVADPPWALQTKGIRRGLVYDRMSTDDIINMNVGDIAAPDAHLWLWTTNPHLPEAMLVVRAWGFTYKSMRTGVKNRMGTGWWLRGKSEHIILAVRSTKSRRNPGNITTVFDFPYAGHSVKPDEPYRVAEHLSPGPRIELFARTTREGWTTLISNAPAGKEQ